jgi:hypothetical protein
MPENTPLPSEERVRELTADPDLSPEDADRHARLFLEAGKPAIALMFLERSKTPERLADVKKLAVAAGDGFLLHNIHRILPDSVTPAEWKEAGEVAQREGKLLFAKDCFDKAGDAEKAEAARKAYLEIFKASAGP